MKRIIIAIILVTVTSGAASAEGMLFGVKGGMNLANWTGSDTEFLTLDNKMKVAFGGGIWFGYAFNENFSIQPELLLMMKGTKWEESGVTLSANYNYLDLNLLAKMTFPMEGSVTPFIFVGPQIGFLMSAKFKAEYEGDSEEIDVKDEYKDIDFGLAFGGGVDYNLEAGCVSFDVRYNLGLMSIYDGENVDQKNAGIIFMAGYGFAF